MPKATIWISIGSLLAAVLVGPALAFERSRDPYTRRCLWRQERELVFHLNQDCALQGSRRACERALESAAAAWNAAACSDLVIRYGGPTERTEVGFDPARPERNLNLIVVRQATLDSDRPRPSLSTTTYDRTSGIIFDCDIELFDEPGYLTEADLHNVLVHELGHALGLAHSRDRTAVMFQWLLPTAGLRSLAGDDLDALCSLYPAGLPSPACEGEPDGLGGLDSGAGCGLAGSTLAPAGLVGLLGLAFYRRRRGGVRVR